jgi:hypothetical protein
VPSGGFCREETRGWEQQQQKWQKLTQDRVDSGGTAMDLDEPREGLGLGEG